MIKEEATDNQRTLRRFLTHSLGNEQMEAQVRELSLSEWPPVETTENEQLQWPLNREHHFQTQPVLRLRVEWPHPGVPGL